MNSCRTFESLIKNYLAGDISHVERDALLQHARGCEACRQILELHGQMILPIFEVSPEVAAQLKQARRELLEGIGLKVKHSPGSRGGGWNLFFGMNPVPAIALSALFAALGFYGGRAVTQRAEPAPEELLGRIQRLARDTKQLSDVENSPYIFSNVSFRQVDDARIGLSFDVSTHVEFSARKTDPLVKDILVQALMNPSNVGSRLKAISFAEGMRDAQVMEALIFSMARDPNLAVRLKALTILSTYKKDPDVQSALLEVLRTEESVQMRLLAMDYLVDNKVDPEALRQVLRDMNSEKDAPVLVKAGNYLQ